MQHDNVEASAVDKDNRERYYDSVMDDFMRITHESSAIVGFTGAGISTESGISDYRSKGGLWDRYRPIYFDEFLNDPKKRIEYWKRRLEMWPQIASAEPNSGHRFFVDLFNRGKLLGLITQNIDGLHEKSGLPKEKIVNIHGNAREIRCLSCGKITSSEALAERFGPEELEKNGPPVCAECGGLLKPNTISFGQNLQAETLEKAYDLSGKCEAMIVFGSTLVVQPAANFPAFAKRNGASLAIVTLSETPLDDIADVVVRMKIGEFLETLKKAT